ncbi:MAG: hypothetical protein SH818_19810 [Saprospiraceae bacterium]|nr:hypothetical protein [Saprospiraceae bacterium]
MKSILFTICLISILGVININAQNFMWGRFQNNTFNNITAATASDVTSNYGTRNAPGGTRFHRGVDISPIGATNVILAAPTGGTIVRIVNPSLESIGILEIELDALPDPNNPSQNLPQTRLSFLHIFSNGNLPRVNSGFRLDEVSLNGNTYLVIIDLVNCRAFSTTTGISVTCNGQPMNVSNPV